MSDPKKKSLEFIIKKTNDGTITWHKDIEKNNTIVYDMTINDVYGVLTVNDNVSILDVTCENKKIGTIDTEDYPELMKGLIKAVEHPKRGLFAKRK